MDSSSSDHDSIRMLSASDLYDEEDLSLWHDQAALEPFRISAGMAQICNPCQNFFSEHTELQLLYRHFYHLSTLRDTAQRGCQLCVLIRSKIDRETRTHSASDVLKLYFQVYPYAENGRIKYLSLWFHFLRVPKRAKYGDRIWGVKIIDLMFAHDNNDSATVSHKITRNTGANENRSLIHHWLTNCTTKHQECNHPPTRHNWMPTRLLDIGTVPITPSSKLSLVESVNIVPGSEYMSLSHRWGLKQPVTLTQANMERLKDGISISDLPQTFQDAVTVVSWRQCRYIWIDSLCIIQDSILDWQKESGQMRHVYKNARCNIAASGAIDSSVGLFFDRDPRLVSISSVAASWHGIDSPPIGIFHFFMRDIWSHGVGRAPLSIRAWALQERFLARRTLHFGAESIFFECHELEACETFPGGLPPTVFDPRAMTRFKSLSTQQISNGGEKALFLQGWSKIIAAYSACALTFGSDKAIALSGVAQDFQIRSNDIYLAGLWKSCLAEQLLWVVGSNCRQINGQPSVRPSIYRSPSWSWLSIDGIITLPTPKRHPMLIQILEANVSLVDDENPTGQIKGGIVHVCGQLEWISLRRNSETGIEKRQEYYATGKGGAQQGLVWVSFDEKENRPKDVFYMAVRYCWENVIEGLLLVPTMHTPMEFKRVGHFRTCNSETTTCLLEMGKDIKKTLSIV